MVGALEKNDSVQTKSKAAFLMRSPVQHVICAFDKSEWTKQQVNNFFYPFY